MRYRTHFLFYGSKGVRTGRGSPAGPRGRQAGREGLCPGAHSPLELLLAPVQVLGLVPHQVQDSASHLLLKGAPIPTDSQAAEGGWGDTTGLMGPIRPRLPHTHPQTGGPLTPARCQSPWAGRGHRNPAPAAGLPPSASSPPGQVLAAAASGT